jgi:hypothetical protein
LRRVGTWEKTVGVVEESTVFSKPRMEGFRNNPGTPASWYVASAKNKV